MERSLQKKFVIVAFILLSSMGAFGAYEYRTLEVAHSSFDEYYKFRGCEKLLERTDTHARCALHNGTEIKIVLYKGKWYLDGDLPGQW